MKGIFYLSLLSAGAFSAAYGQSLYDLAAPLGLEESIPIQWSLNVSAGYDDNVNASNFNKQESAFISTSVGAKLANYDRVTQYAFTGRLGGIFYLKSLDDGAKNALNNTSMTFNLSHSFDPTLRYSGSATFNWQPEPNYASGVSQARRDGDYIYVNLSNSISKAWTKRDSTTFALNASSLNYQEDSAKADNRDYLIMEVTQRHKTSERLALSANWRGSYCWREYGNNEISNFVLAGVEYAISQNTSFTFRVGPQFKNVKGHGTKAYPSMEMGLNHRISDRFTMGLFARYSNEATNTYVSNKLSYSSNESWRVGLTSTLMLTNRVSMNFGMNLVTNNYNRPTSAAGTDTKNITFNASTGFIVKLTQSLSANVTYSYTNGSYSGYSYSMPAYNRNVISAGLSYSF